MNAQNPADQTKQDEAKKVAEVKAAEARKAAEAQAKQDAESDTPSEPVAGGAGEVVTLVHADHDAVVKVAKPSPDYTNYVRGFGYREQESK